MNSNLFCRWSGCGLNFSDPDLLDEHVVDHIDLYLPSGVRRRCQWAECEYPPPSFDVLLPAFIRHLRFHVYTEYLVEHSITVLKEVENRFSIDAAKCTSIHRRPIHILTNLACLWQDCSFQSESFIDFERHLAGHARSHPTDCLWSLPNENCKNLKCPMLSHLLSHIGLGTLICPVCRSFFSEVISLQNHLKMSVKRSTGHLLSTNETFCCFWLSCDSRFLSYEHLHRHVLKHLSEEHSEFCFWLHCPFPELSGLSHTNKRRHVLLHVFAEFCRQLAVNLLRQINITETIGSVPCQRPPMDNWFTRELAPTSKVITYGFRCMWNDCNVVSECAYLFRLHASNHLDADSLKTDEATFDTVSQSDSFLTCKWRLPSFPMELCPVKTSCRRKLKNHLTAHMSLPLLLCPFCDTVLYSRRSFYSHLAAKRKSTREQPSKRPGRPATQPLTIRRFPLRPILPKVPSLTSSNSNCTPGLGS
uniref:Histone H4 transcription factor n=1 Tax=Schistocephalus solidus TaxID=70667 RepID=A0A0X3NJ97_SCHSO